MQLGPRQCERIVLLQGATWHGLVRRRAAAADQTEAHSYVQGVVGEPVENSTFEAAALKNAGEYDASRLAAQRAHSARLVGVSIASSKDGTRSRRSCNLE